MKKIVSILMANRIVLGSLILLLILALTVTGCSEIIDQVLNFQSTTPPSAQTQKAPVAALVSQDIIPSAGEQTVSWKDQVKVTIPAGLVDSKQTLTISPAPTLPPPTFKGLVGLGGGYDISMGETKEFKNDLTIEIAYDPIKIKSDLPLEKALMSKSWDPDQNIWVTDRTEVDTQRNVIIIRTNHLSVRQTFYIPTGWTVRETKHFIIVYNPKETFEILEFAQSQQRQGQTLTNTYPMEQMAGRIAPYLEQAWEAYFKANFLMPLGDSDEEGRLWVFLDTTTDVSYRANFSGDLYFATKYVDTQYSVGADQLRHEAAHELFHAVQNRYFRLGGMVLRRWWMEATADYAADVIAGGGTGTMPLVPTNYFSQSITITDSKHEYKTSRFVAYLARPTGSFLTMWSDVASSKQGSDVHLAIDEYLKTKRSSSLQNELRDFTAYVLFDSNGPLSPTLLNEKAEIPVMDKGLLNSPAVEKVDIMEANKADLGLMFKNLGRWYTAQVWGIRVKTQAGQQRSLKLEIPGAPISSQVTFDVYVLKNDLRPGGGAKREGTLSGSSPQIILRPVDNDDVVYIVKVNSASNDSLIQVKVTEVSTAKWVQVGKVESVDPSKDGPLSKGAFPTSATISGNSATVNSQKSYSQIVDKVAKESLLAASRWKGTWTEPPQEMAVGQKWSGKVTLVDSGSEAPKGGYKLNGNINISVRTSGATQKIVEISNSVPAGSSQVNPGDFSWTAIGPSDSGTSPQQMSIFVQTAASGRNTAGGDDLLYSTTATVEYKYELRK